MSKQEESLAMTARRTLVVVGVVTGSALLLYFLYAVRSVLFQLVVAAILALALLPLTRWLKRRRINQVWASIIALAVTLAVVLGVVAAIATPLVTQGSSLIENTPTLVNKATSNPLFRDLNNKYQLVGKAKQLSADLPKIISGSSSPILGVVGSAFSAVSNFFVILFLALFILMEGPSAWRRFTKLLPKGHARFARTVSHRLEKAVGGYVNGNLFISLICGIFTFIILLIFHVPYALALAALVAVFDLIPLVGAVLGTVIAALVALTQGLWVALAIAAIMVLYQFVEGNIVQPIIYGKSVEMSQLLILVATIVGGLLGGIVGVLLSIPIAAALQIVLVETLKLLGTDITADLD